MTNKQDNVALYVKYACVEHFPTKNTFFKTDKRWLDKLRGHVNRGT